MAGTRRSMRKIREVLRLTHELGLSVRFCGFSSSCSWPSWCCRPRRRLSSGAGRARLSSLIPLFVAARSTVLYAVQGSWPQHGLSGFRCR
jgi:hypothetical protein